MNMLAITPSWSIDLARGLPDWEELEANKIPPVNTLK
jgi:hypothetical protein